MNVACQGNLSGCHRFTSPVAYPGILFGGEGVQQIQLRTVDRENGELGAVASYSGLPIWFHGVESENFRSFFYDYLS